MMVKGPAPDGPTDGLQRLRASRGQKGVREEITMPDRLPGPKRVAKKVERLVRVIPTPPSFRRRGPTRFKVAAVGKAQSIDSFPKPDGRVSAWQRLRAR